MKYSFVYSDNEMFRRVAAYYGSHSNSNKYVFLADPGEAMGSSTNTTVTDSLINSFSDPLVSHSFAAPPRPNG